MYTLQSLFKFRKPLFKKEKHTSLWLYVYMTYRIVDIKSLDGVATVCAQGTVIDPFDPPSTVTDDIWIPVQCRAL